MAEVILTGCTVRLKVGALIAERLDGNIPNIEVFASFASPPLIENMEIIAYDKKLTVPRLRLNRIELGGACMKTLDEKTGQYCWWITEENKDAGQTRTVNAANS